MTQTAWDEIFMTQQWGRYPSEMVVREVMEFRPRLHIDQLAALDLGCGAGSNTTMLAENSFQVIAIDSSAEALKQAEVNCHARSVDKMVQFVRTDYVAEPQRVHNRRFNVIVDWLSLTHAPWDAAIRTAYGLVETRLGSPGRYILGMFGPDTAPSALLNRPPVTRWSDIDLAHLGSDLCGLAIRQEGKATRYHLEEQVYTRKGKRVQIWCLVIEND